MDQPALRPLPSRRPGVLPWLTVVVVLAAGAAAEPKLIMVAGAGLIAVAVWRWPESATAVCVAGILVVRPALDTFSERRFGLSLWTLNPAVAFGGTILWVGAVLGYKRVLARERLWPDRGTFTAHKWLALAYITGVASGTRLYGQLGLADGARDALRMASVVAGFLLVTWWLESKPQRVRQGWWWLWAGAVVPIAVAVVQWTRGTGPGFSEELGLNRLQSTFSHANTFGLYLVPFVLILSAGLSKRNKLLNVERLVVAWALTMLIALSYSRTALLVLLAGFLVLPLLHAPTLGWGSVRRGVVVILVVGAVGWALVGRIVSERFNGISFGRAAWEQAAMGQSENSFEWRLINWGVLVTMGLNHPWLGHGVGMTTELNPLISTENGLSINAHNDFVRFFFEGGVVGLVAYTAYFAMICLCAYRRAKAGGGLMVSNAYAVTAAWIASVFLSLGTTELSLNTALLYELYAMLALIGSYPLTWQAAGSGGLEGAA